MLRKLIATHIGAILALPFIMAIVIPFLILMQSGTNVGWGLRFPLNLFPTVVGLALIGEGFLLVTSTIRLFITVGQGTLAPWSPTQHLVVTGIYRYVRNPMISGVFAILLGETILFRSQPLLYWTIGFLVVNMIYMPLIEEPGLRRRFGADYDNYARNVPRWFPRRTPWTPTQPR
jgi:protein-S-isoprenylcysteine O-methyltransferase Ste14